MHFVLYLHEQQTALFAILKIYINNNFTCLHKIKENIQLVFFFKDVNVKEYFYYFEKVFLETNEEILL